MASGNEVEVAALGVLLLNAQTAARYFYDNGDPHTGDMAIETAVSALTALGYTGEQIQAGLEYMERNKG